MPRQRRNVCVRTKVVFGNICLRRERRNHLVGRRPVHVAERIRGRVTRSVARCLALRCPAHAGTNGVVVDVTALDVTCSRRGSELSHQEFSCGEVGAHPQCFLGSERIAVTAGARGVLVSAVHDA